ncbi:MAG: DUF1326 domain-containing protein [Burkholderiales bacterium]
MNQWKMKGEYLKNCNCLASCPCDTIGFPAPHANCEGMAAMRISEGNFGGVKLDGLHWAGAVWWPNAMHEGNGKVQFYIDERADKAQREALGAIMSGKNGGTLFEIINAICPTHYPTEYVPFTWEFNKDARRARMAAGNFIRTSSRPLTVPATGDEQRVIVRLPGGFEYKEMEVALAETLEISGPMNFSHKNSHSSLAFVEHTQAGLAA